MTMTGIGSMPYGEEWVCGTGTGSIDTGTTCLKAVVLASAFLIGTGGTMDARYFSLRHDMGYKFTQIESAPAPHTVPYRTPAEKVTYIRDVLKPTVSEFASLFEVSRQAVYDWQNGAQPAPEHEKKLEDLSRAVDVLMMEGVPITPYLLKRRVRDGKTLLEVAREGGSAEAVARQLSEMVMSEIRQRRALDARLASRKPPAIDFTDAGTPTFNEESL